MNAPQDIATTRPAGRRADKHDAITAAARVVFARDGYSRSSIDAIAKQAAVSTRTIYNHFDGKEQLFSLVLRDSATQVADAFIENVARQLAATPEPELTLAAIGRALVAHRVDFPEHFAMVSQITAEARHFPPGAFDAWQDAGPRRVRREVIRRLEELAALGLLRIANPNRAAIHLIALTTFEITSRSERDEITLTEQQTTEIITAGVRAFLDGYAPRSSSSAGPSQRTLGRDPADVELGD